MTDIDMDTIIADHARAQIDAETTYIRLTSPVYSTHFVRRAIRYMWRAAIRYVLTTQQEWHTLPTRDAIHELQKGAGSIYHPIFNDGTPGLPAIWCDCPTCGRTTTDSEGLCHTCGYDHLA